MKRIQQHPLYSSRIFVKESLQRNVIVAKQLGQESEVTAGASSLFPVKASM